MLLPLWRLVKSHRLLDFGNRPTRVKTLGASVGTVHDGVATVQRHRVLQHLLSHLGGLVSRVDDPSVGLHQHGGPQVLGLVPPVRGTRGRAARTQNTFVQPVQLGSVSDQLQVFPAISGLVLSLQPRLDRLVLLVEVGQVGNKVSHHVHVGQGVDLEVGLVILVDLAKTGQGVSTANVHGARATDTFSARSSESESGVLFVLNLEQRVQHHGPAFVKVDFVGLEGGLDLGGIRVPAVDLELLDVGLLLGSSGETSEGLLTKHGSKHGGWLGLKKLSPNGYKKSPLCVCAGCSCNPRGVNGVGGRRWRRVLGVGGYGYRC